MNRVALTLSLIAAALTGATAAHAEAGKKKPNPSTVVTGKSKGDVSSKGQVRSAGTNRNDQGCRKDRQRCAANLFGLSGVELAAAPGQQTAFGPAKGSNGQTQFGPAKGSDAPQQFGPAKGSSGTPPGYKVGTPPPPKGYPTGTAPANQGYPTTSGPATGGQQGGYNGNNGYNGGNNNSGGYNSGGYNSSSYNGGSYPASNTTGVIVSPADGKKQ